jgi:N6-adenosine-specific RNA methylase IME4
MEEMDLMDREIQLIVDPEFRSLIAPLAKERLEGLEHDLLRDGCRDALVAWRQEGGYAVVLDGHSRLEICLRHNLPYRIKVLDLESGDEAKRWILENQRNRRNFSPSQRALLAAQLATLPAHRPGRESAQACALSQSEAVEDGSTSRRTLQHAKRVLNYGSPKLLEALKRDIITASLASVITRLPLDEQDRVAEDCRERGDAQPARVAAAKAKRQAKPQSGRTGTDTPAMDGPPRFAVVLADPWRIEGERVSGDPENADRYPMVPADKIRSARRQLASEVQPDAVLFLRAPGPLLAQALKMMKVWGFELVAHIVCLKPSAGCDGYVSYEHNVLLIGARGNQLLPKPVDRTFSVTNAEPPGIIEEIYPNQPWLDLFACTERPGSNSCGKDAPEAINPDEADIDLD